MFSLVFLHRCWYRYMILVVVLLYRTRLRTAGLCIKLCNGAPPSHSSLVYRGRGGGDRQTTTHKLSEPPRVKLQQVMSTRSSSTSKQREKAARKSKEPSYQVPYTTLYYTTDSMKKNDMMTSKTKTKRTACISHIPDTAADTIHDVRENTPRSHPAGCLLQVLCKRCRCHVRGLTSWKMLFMLFPFERNAPWCCQRSDIAPCLLTGGGGNTPGGGGAPAHAVSASLMPLPDDRACACCMGMLVFPRADPESGLGAPAPAPAWRCCCCSCCCCRDCCCGGCWRGCCCCAVSFNFS